MAEDQAGGNGPSQPTPVSWPELLLDTLCIWSEKLEKQCFLSVSLVVSWAWEEMWKLLDYPFKARGLGVSKGGAQHPTIASFG